MNNYNILIYISHDSGRFVEPYGYNTIETPALNRLAKEGVTFTKAFCTTPLCAPARSAITTGQYPHKNGMNGLPGDMLGGWDMAPGGKKRHLAAVLKENGYASVLCGFMHESHDLFSVGFEEGIHGIGKSNNAGWPLKGAAEDMADWLDRKAEKGDKRPFYMQVGSHDTHREWTKDAKPYSDKGVWKAPYLIDDPEVDREMAEQQGAINEMDRGLAEILDMLDKRRLSENTIVIFTTDHGIDFPRAKGTMFDPGLETMLFIRHPEKRWTPGMEIEALTSTIDLYPTILEALDIPIPHTTHGKSLIPLLEGKKILHREKIYFEKTYHDNYDPIRGLRTDRFKYVLNFDAQTLYDVRIATAPRYNWFKFPFKKDQREELYDLETDPCESKNLASEPEFKERVDQFRKDLALWMKETEDPLLKGPMPSPYHMRRIREMRELAKS
jgi:N-sulfoglucosamine sulfohydrolase